MPLRRFALAWLLCVLLLLLICACSHSSTPRLVHSAHFLGLGAAIEHAKLHAPANQYVSKLTPRLSDPEDITGPGDYLMTVRPESRDSYNPDVISFTPPADAAFIIQFHSPTLHCPARGTDCSITFTMTVSNYQSPYPAFQTWVS